MPRSRRIWACFGIGIALIVLPALLFTPLIPYLDSVGFAYINSYPAKASYGPQHYYLFQFTYILHHIISRAATDLGVSPAMQVLFYYLIMGLSFYVAAS